MNTGHLARCDEILQYTVSLDHQVLVVNHFHLFAEDGIDERQVRQFAVEQVRQRFDHLAERRFLDKHSMEQSVGRVCLRVLFDTSSGERSITDVHGEQQIVDPFFSIHHQHHVLRFVVDDSIDEREGIIDTVTTHIVLERLGFLTAQRIDSKTDGVDEIAVMLNAISPIGQTADIDRMPFALKESAQTLFVVLGQVPIPRKIVSCSARHQSHLYLSPLLSSQIRPHDAVDGFGQGAVSAKDQDLIVSLLHQFASQLGCVPGELGYPVRKRLMTLTQ